MTNPTTGDIQAFADAIVADRASPDLTKYLLTLDLTEDEQVSVKKSFATWNRSVTMPTDAPVPTIVDRWL